jgi:peptidoglycan/LPS O-acetylase OafA/YrhL
MKKESSRIPSLDGIRAISIFLVLICHYGRDVGWGDPFDLGSLGVRIFFVISGYLITGLLLSELEKQGHIKLGRFYFRRTLRIFPAFYVYLGLMLLIARFGWAELTVREALPAALYVSNYSLHLVQNVAHTWSLSTEEQFYLIWPAVLAFSGRRRAVYSLLLLLIIAPLSSSMLTHRLGHQVPAFFNSPIGVGCLLGLIRESLRRFSLYRWWIQSGLGLILPIIIFCSNLPAVAKHYGSIMALILNFSIALFIDWAVSNPTGIAGKILNNRLMVATGLVSYSLYLWQQPFLALLYAEPSLYLSGPWKIIETPLARFALIALCTALSYRLVEKPMLHVRGWLEPKIFPNKKPLTTSLPNFSAPAAEQTS